MDQCHVRDVEVASEVTGDCEQFASANIVKAKLLLEIAVVICADENAAAIA
jgi:hypothetical protein